MQIFATTPRLVLRELHPTDAAGMFELDSDPDVHRYLGRQPVQSIDQCRDVIEFVRRQYAENGIGRWAAIEKDSGEFIGWIGLKLITDPPINGRTGFHDVGYRLIKRFWGQGYATEGALAAIDYGFTELQLPEIYAFAHVDNRGSRNVLEKCGLQYVETFDYDGEPHASYRIDSGK
jgi:ribosomal-protein-alanine N-acetyltransferase